jgi:hypothetical protein
VVSALDVCGLWAVGCGRMRRRQVGVWLIDGIIMFCVLLFNSVSYVFYCYVCSVLYILFSSCQLALFGYPD